MKKFPKSNKILLLILIFSGFLLYSHEAGAILDVVPSLASMQLDALDFIDRVVTWLFNLLLLALAGGFFISFSAAFLDWASALPIGLSGNQLVEAGWGFTSGLVNIIFILIFIVIALSYILKLETRDMKKALPRLIIIAFLLNFSLLFIKIFADISWIFLNSIKVALFGSGGIALPVANVVANGLKTAVAEYFTWFFVPYFAVVLIPFASTARLIHFATTVLSEGMFGTFSETFLLAMFSIVGGLIFLAYAILFLARIAVIWLLAVVAPLAFAAYILPQTQKYFSQWLKTLFQWVFLGVVIFFLMGFGLKLFTIVAPSSSFQVRGTNLVAEYSKLIFLLIYLFITLLAAKRFTPTAANAVWAAAGLAVGAGTGLVATVARRTALRGEALRSGYQAKRAETRVRPLELKREAGTITAKEETQLKKWAGRQEVASARATMFRGLEIQEQRSKIAAKTKGMDEETRKSYLLAEVAKHQMSSQGLRNKNKSAALALLLANEDIIGNKHLDLYDEAWKAAGPDDYKKNPVKKAALAKMPNWATYAERKEMKTKWNTGTIEKWSNDAKEDEVIVREVVGTHRADLITRLGASTGEASKKVQAEIDRTAGEEWRKLVKEKDKDAYMARLTLEQQKTLLQQLEVIRYLHHSFFGELQTWKKYGTMDKKDKDNNVERFIEMLRKKIK